jgi:MFS family permease
MADRVNAGISLMLNGLIQALVWLILISPASFGLLVLDAILIGACGGGYISAKGVLVSRVYGSANFAAVMGASGLATLPFLFGMAPLAGLMRERMGDYRLAVLIFIAGFVIAACCFVMLGIEERRINRKRAF